MVALLSLMGPKGASAQAPVDWDRVAKLIVERGLNLSAGERVALFWLVDATVEVNGRTVITDGRLVALMR